MASAKLLKTGLSQISDRPFQHLIGSTGLAAVAQFAQPTWHTVAVFLVLVCLTPIVRAIGDAIASAIKVGLPSAVLKLMGWKPNKCDRKTAVPRSKSTARAKVGGRVKRSVEPSTKGAP